MKLEKVIPFGRSLDEYRCMFNLTPLDLEKNIVSIGDGPASFNAEMKQLGKLVTSVDPVYVYEAVEIESQFNMVVDNIITQVKQTPNDWVWTYHHSPEQLKANRVNVLNTYINDFKLGKIEKRYVVDELPNLSLDNHQYDIALCSHFLFLYSEHFDYEFHLASIIEMLRIAKEIRVFPLLTLNLKKSPYLEPLLHELEFKNYEITIEKVEYELQKGGNEMLTIRNGYNP